MQPMRVPASTGCRRDVCPELGVVGWSCWRNLLFLGPFPVAGLPTYESDSMLAESTAAALGFNVPSIRDVP